VQQSTVLHTAMPDKLMQLAHRCCMVTVVLLHHVRRVPKQLSRYVI
jgi:hypothetical protein